MWLTAKAQKSGYDMGLGFSFLLIRRKKGGKSSHVVLHQIEELTVSHKRSFGNLENLKDTTGETRLRLRRSDCPCCYGNSRDLGTLRARHVGLEVSSERNRLRLREEGAYAGRKSEGEARSAQE